MPPTFIHTIHNNDCTRHLHTRAMVPFASDCKMDAMPCKSDRLDAINLFCVRFQRACARAYALPMRLQVTYSFPFFPLKAWHIIFMWQKRLLSRTALHVLSVGHESTRFVCMLQLNSYLYRFYVNWYHRHWHAWHVNSLEIISFIRLW